MLKRLVALASLIVLLVSGCASEPAHRPFEVASTSEASPPTTVIPTTTVPPTTTTHTHAPKSRTAVTRGSRATVAAPGPVSGDVWGALARCESGGNPRAVSRNGKFFGAFQFMLSTWRSVGGTGNPIDHSYGEQLQRAQILQARSGWGQWPHCARKLGLR